jgi:Zn-dependent M28 family amino/carboxypeptidase
MPAATATGPLAAMISPVWRAGCYLHPILATRRVAGPRPTPCSRPGATPGVDVNRSPIPLGLALLLALPGCAPTPRLDAPAPQAAQLEPALARITAEGIYRHIEVLASDRFEGRAPGTAGEDSTVRYLTEQFRRIGLEPGNPDGSYVQAVPLVGIRSQATARFRAGGRTIEPRPLEDIVTMSRRIVPEVRVDDAELVFVGYGVVAPEYDWDDFKDVDVRGKTVVMLINDPPVPAAGDATRLDPDLFRGAAMTYYGRWTYKYEIASERGAAAVLIVHETEPAGYGWQVVRGSWGAENFDIQRQDGNAGRVAVEGWVTLDQARALFAAGGQDFDRLKQAAARRDFRPVALGATASFEVRNTHRTVQSRNVVARLPGSDPALRDEHIVFTAHWDHLGMTPIRESNNVFNGALDNASGTAAVLQLAEAFTALPERPRRSLLFLAVTAEERGLLGAKYYVSYPLYPLERTLANINLDMRVDAFGRTRDIIVVGSGNTTMEDDLARLLAADGRRVTPDPDPEKGFFYRSDHFEFAKMGVPALYTKAGTDYIDDAEAAIRRRTEFETLHYHQPTDEIDPTWDLGGAVEDLRVLFRLALQIANGEQWPEWKPGTEFRAVRERMLREGGRR